MGTIHAASMLELISRVESQPMNVPRVMVANLDLVIFLATIRKGEQKVRRVREIIEILGMNPTSNELITNVVFRWNPIRDELEFIGRSFLVEKIGESFGIAKEKLEEEIKMRTNLLELMRLKGILNYQEVTKIVRKYYIDREGALSHIKEEKQATSVLVQWEKRDKGEE